MLREKGMVEGIHVGKEPEGVQIVTFTGMHPFGAQGRSTTFYLDKHRVSTQIQLNYEVSEILI